MKDKKMSKNCLDCKYEPEWGKWTSGEYKRQHGRCKWNKPIPKLPAVVSVQISGITRYEDNSGVMLNCKTWEQKI